MFPLPSGWHSSILILTFFQRWSHTSSSFNMVQVHSLSVVFILSVAAAITPVIVALPLQAHHQEPTIDPRLWVVYVQWSSVCHILNPVHRLTGHPSLVPHSTNPRRVPLLNPYPLDRPIYPGPQQASTQDHHPHSDSDHQSQSGSQAHTPSPSPGPHPGSPGSQNHVPHTDLPGSQAHTPSPSPSPHPGSPGSQNHGGYTKRDTVRLVPCNHSHTQLITHTLRASPTSHSRRHTIRVWLACSVRINRLHTSIHNILCLNYCIRPFIFLKW